MKFLNYLKNICYLITHPSYWIMLYKYNKEYDTWFNNLLDKYKFEQYHIEELKKYYIKLGDEIFWYQNQPYACFSSELSSFNRNINSKTKFRASRLTILKAIEKLNQEYKD